MNKHRALISFILFSLCFSLLSLLLISSPAFADGTYRWVDSKGVVFYGSKPPPNARSVEKLKGGKLSHYSSEKMLKRLGWKKGAKKQNSEKLSGIIKEPIPVSLEHDQVRLELNDKSEITSCIVGLNNTGSTDAVEISIAFEFIDGTLIPAAGPERLEKGTSADYEIPQELLPLIIQTENDDTGDTPEEPLMPRVIIHGVGEE